ncbi:hypothetical protein ACF0H5_011053 [Mactra antiquata]
MTTDDKEERMNSVDNIDDAINEAVRVTLDWILDKVEIEVNRISTLRSLAQRIIDEMIRNVTYRNRDPGSGDIMQRGSWNYCENVQQNTTYRQNNECTQGLSNRNIDDHDAIESIKQAINRSRSMASLILQSTRHQDYNTELDSLRRAYSMPSGISLQSLHTSREQLNSHSGQVGKSDSKSSVNKNECKQNEEKSYLRYKIVNTLSTPHGEIKVYANGEIDDTERIRILHESVNILKAREQAVKEQIDNGKQEKKDGNDDNDDKRSGLFARVKKFFRKMCCCCCHSSD